MSISKIVSNLSNGNFSKASGFIGNKVSKSLEKSGSSLDKFLKTVEPTGANNAFIPMSGLMVGMVIVPRVLTAAKRNPNDKEATKDEIKEILFRDVQTVAIVLFALKIANALIASGVSKFNGLPMTSKCFDSFKDVTSSGIKGFFDKTKVMGKNFLNVIHPTGGIRSLTNDEFVSRYSNAGDIKGVQRIFNEIKDKKGKPEKVFDKVMNAVVESQEALINKYDGTGLENIEEGTRVLEKLKEVQKMGYSALSEENIDSMDESVQKRLVAFFKDPDNLLVHSAKKLNGWLRTGALALESTYLGFGLPALNQKRLEKKYLSEDSKQNSNTLINSYGFNPLIDKNMKAQEIKVFRKFIK